MTIRTFLTTIFLLVSATVSAQFDTAAVVGTVRDPSGSVVPGATVTLTNTATSVSATRTTNNEGLYEFVTVRPGIYIVTAEKSGFSVALMDNVEITVGARQRVDIGLAIGQVSERVQVTAERPLLDTQTSQRGQVIGGNEIRELALNGREYSSLALLANGVRLSSQNKSNQGTPREGSFNVNGLRNVFNNFLIDGVDNNAYGTSNQGFSSQVMQPPPDAISEFRVVTNNQSAEYGRAAGATINVAYRSGTNQLSGGAWEFFRDTKLNAEPYFLPPDGKKPPLRRNQYGGVLGGPIVQNRAFFFGDFEGFRQERQSAVFSTIPTAAQASGILAVDVRDPRTGTVYPAGTPIPMTAFARKVLSALPAPTTTAAANNYSLAQTFNNENNKAGGKVDLQASNGLSFFGRYGWRDVANTEQPPIPLPAGGGANGTLYVRNKQLVLGSTWVTGSSSLFEARLGWSNTEGGKNPPALGSGSDFALPGLPSDARVAGGLNSQSINGFAALGRQATNPQWQYPTIWNPKVNYSWLVGRQSFKAGYEFQHVAVEVMDVNPLYGLDSYTGQFTRPAGAGANNLYNLSDFMLGLRSQYALSTLFVAEMRKNMHFLYLQDDIRATSRLTFNLGLRYEYASPMWEADNSLTNFDPATRTMLQAKDGSIYDRALVNPDRNNIGPRLGLAFALDEQTAIRGGWGVSFSHLNRIGSADILAINGPQVVRAVVNQTDATTASFRPTEQGYPADLLDPGRFNPATNLISYIDKDFESSSVQSWFASVQRRIGADHLVDVAYVGNHSDNLLLLGNYNQAAPNNSAGTLSLAQRRTVVPGFGDITYVFNGGRSHYDALQLRYEWHPLSGATLSTALTLSRAKNNADQSLEAANGNFPGAQDINNLDADYALAGYHQPYNSTTSFVYTLPFGRDTFWGDWQVAGVNTITPGEGVTFTYVPAAAFQVSGITNDFAGANNYRPNVTCDPYSSDRSITNYFNRDCVVIPTDPSQPFGNAVRNSVRGPGFWTFDLAVSKYFPLGGRAKAQLRLEAFNLFNRTNFLAPNGQRTAAAFGTITAAYDPRQLQVGVKLLW
jgi:hypothetical protein